MSRYVLHIYLYISRKFKVFFIIQTTSIVPNHLNNIYKLYKYYYLSLISYLNTIPTSIIFPFNTNAVGT